jgi:hypothetical protein
MNILEALLDTQGGAIIKQIGAQFGLNEAQVQNAIKVVVPILAAALIQNMKSGGGLDSLLGALKGGKHDRYIDDPSILGQPTTKKDGNGILEHLLGDKAVSRETASRASANTGIDSSILQKLLPVLAAAVMGGLNKQGNSGGLFGSNQTSQSAGDGLMSILQPAIDQNGDGSALDDIIGMAARYLR